MINVLLIWFVRALLWLRYRVAIRGVAAIAAKGRDGILFLPTHPALIDPIILFSRLFGPFKTRGLGDKEQISRFFVRWMAKRVGILPIPDLAKSGAASAEEVRRIVDECVDVLANGENLVLYPAGHILRTRLEDIGGNSAAATIMNRLPDVRVVLVRTRGLWGSGFSWATGAEPGVGGTLWRGFRALLASGVFFAPRRCVTIEMVEPDDLPRNAERNVINRYIERFYNADAPPNTYVPRTIWDREGVRELPEPVRPQLSGDPGQTPAATRRIVCEFLEELTGESDFGDTARLAHDLGADSLTRVDILTWLHGEFGFAQTNVDDLQTVGDVMLAACGESVSTATASIKPVSAKWFTRPASAAKPPQATEMTVCEAFLHQAARAPGKVIVADQNSGAKTFGQLVRGVLALKGPVELLPGERIGVMMPASVAADVLYLTALFAGKTPVMVNWTLGSKNLTHCLDSVGVRKILTARALISRLESQGVDLSAVADRLVFIEDMAAGLSGWAKLRAAVGAKLNWSSLRNACVPETAVILFTSGSENLPKAVPLTHRNMLTNLDDAFEVIKFTGDDCLLGMLPPFHSFGLTGGVLLPLCLGLRTVHYGDPTDASALAQIAEAYRPTLLVGTPTFLHGIVRAAAPEQLASLRVVVTGAEKCGPRVYAALAARCPQTVVMEGYGVTECSPIISANERDNPKPGTIGKVFGSVEYALLDLDTDSRAAPGQPGMLVVRGPSVFGGYLEYDGPSPFVELDGLQWYRTGDIVVEDDSGVLTFRGRLKRFIKLGGEMISLPAIENVLAERFAEDGDEGPILAVTATGGDEKPEVVLCTVKAIDRMGANGAIRAAGLSGLHNIRRVVRLDELPLLGTGKTDHRGLAERLRNDTD